MSTLTEQIKASLDGGHFLERPNVMEHYKILALVAIAEAIERGASNTAARAGASSAADGERTYGGSQ